MNKKQKLLIAFVGIGVVLVLVLLLGGFGKNNAQNWQIVQHLNGKMIVRDRPGVYLRFFATVWTYPRFKDATFNDVKGEGKKTKESVRVTFNDGGTADTDTYVRFQTPLTADDRINFHRNFNGNIENAAMAVKAHLNNCLKAAAPLMSASENQSSRKAEFAQVVDEMMRLGLFEMRRVEKGLKDRLDEKGNPVTVTATEIILDKEGRPKISQISPLQSYKITIEQFSVTSTEYDEQTRLQFAAKKKSFLEAEQAKAERERQVQQKLMMKEQKLAELAEIEGEANKEKMKAVVEAEKNAEVAIQVKIEKETAANMRLEVAKIAKAEAETKANEMLQVVTINLTAAQKDAERIIALAKAEQERIQLAGAITEKDKTLAIIKAERDVSISKALASIKSPSVVFSGGNGTGSDGQDMMMNMINFRILQQAGIIPNDGQFGEILPVPIAPTSK